MFEKTVYAARRHVQGMNALDILSFQSIQVQPNFHLCAPLQNAMSIHVPHLNKADLLSQFLKLTPPLDPTKPYLEIFEGS